MRLARLALLWTIATVPAFAQAATSFEVASVKVSPRRSGTAAYTAVESDPSMVRYANITLRNLIAIAYRSDSRLVSSKLDWLDTETYDVAAKMPPDTPKNRVPLMLQALLAERFKLTLHRETREEHAYLMVVGKNGPKLKPGREPASQNQMLRGRIMGSAMPMGVLASMLASFVGDQVVDRTGLSGTFDIDLKWTPEQNDTGGADLFTSLQEQLGLKLQAGKAKVETLVVDHAERVPAEN